MAKLEARRLIRPLRENPYFTFLMWGFPDDPEFELIGKPLPPKDAEKATGHAVYVSDVRLPGMLYAKWLTSPYAHAKVKRVDVGEAKALPGVVDVLVCGDPDLASPLHLEGLGAGWNVKIPDWAFVLPSEAVYEGQPVGVAVCAQSPEICDEALRRVRVEWEQLPFVLDRDEALKPDAPITQFFRNQTDNIVRELPMTRGETKFVQGDIEEGFRQADRIIEFEIKCAVNTIAGVEPFHSIAWLHDGYLDLWVRHQLPQGNQLAVMPAAQLAGVPMNNVRCHQAYVAGTFGGITFLGNSVIPVLLATLFSKRTGRPVKVIADWTPFSGITCEEEGRYTFKVGFKNDGTVTAIQVLSNGTYGYAGLTIPGSKKLPKATAVKNIYCESVYPYVNKAPCVCYRHGTQETIPFIEVFNRVAAELDMDPTEVALKNDGCYGHPMHPDMDEIKREQGFPIRDSLKECIEAGKKAIGWEGKWHPPAAKKLPNGKYHGVAFAWTKVWRAGPEGPVRLSGSVFFKFDGTVLIKAQRSFVGLSEPTTYCQVFAEEAGLRYEDVGFDNQFMEAPIATPGGSGGLEWNSAIMKGLGIKTRQKLLEVAAKHFGKSPQELTVKDSVVFEKGNPQNRITVRDLVRRYYYEFRGGIFADGWDYVKGIEMPPSPRKVYFWGRQVAFLEVEVDSETGGVEIKNLVIVNDAGKVINPHGVSGQQYGGAYMGLGRAWTEEIVYDPLTGVKLNDDLSQYGVLSMGDIFPTHCIAVETMLGYGAYGNFGIGENCSCLVRAVLRAAIQNAIGKWINEDPITPDKILKALGKA
ncbi:MAG: xanthine dehydrogenase family protein molybdopterin-binding subunit [Candidatus Bathyarchaeota archaeon]|nr:xanthine dehydrogenase family protein molybdopterin-binding subunit [Candidatus Bathyarchaeota archaeon]